MRILTGAAGREGPPYVSPERTQRYQVWAGLTGERPALSRAADRPFRDLVSLLGDPFAIRMDAWLPADTFRRGGFGHVIRGRDRVLFVERGVSLVSFRPDGAPVVTYSAGVYAPRPRFRIPASVPQLAIANPAARTDQTH